MQGSLNEHLSVYYRCPFRILGITYPSFSEIYHRGFLTGSVYPEPFLL